jgi:predicted  nucleic acid-binding Zn-ribbon protein
LLFSHAASLCAHQVTAANKRASQLESQLKTQRRRGSNESNQNDAQTREVHDLQALVAELQSDSVRIAAEADRARDELAAEKQARAAATATLEAELHRALERADAQGSKRRGSDRRAHELEMMLVKV